MARLRGTEEVPVCAVNGVTDACLEAFSFTETFVWILLNIWRIMLSCEQCRRIFRVREVYICLVEEEEEEGGRSNGPWCAASQPGGTHTSSGTLWSQHTLPLETPAVSHTHRKRKGETKVERQAVIKRERERQGARKERRRKTKRLSEKMINDSSHFTSFRSLPPSLYSIVFFYQSIICEDNAKRQPGLVI